jgi:hypothetical protein
MLILAILSFLGFWVLIGNSEREPSWRVSIVQATILWSAYLIISTEALSWFHAISRLALSIVWSLPVLAGTLWVWLRLKKRRILRLPVVYHRDTWMGFVLDVILILMVLTTSVVAFVSPPNSSEAMTFQMSRVAHWAQNQSLDHYATEIDAQNSSAPGAELIQLNLYVLSGSDQAANMVSWMAFVGSIAAAASLADVLGASLRGRRFAAIFGATLPAAITQATGSMSDIVVTFWVLSAILMLLHYVKKSQKRLILVLSALAAALAVLTNPMALIFLLPFALYAVVALWKWLGMGRMLLWAVIAFAIMGLINGGTFYRNQMDYGKFWQPRELAGQTNEIRNWRVMISNISRNSALQLNFPVPGAEIRMQERLDELHEKLGLAVDDPRTTAGGEFYIPEISTSERTSGSPLHAILFMVSFVAVVGLVLLGKEDPHILAYSGLIFVSLALFCVLLKWEPTGAGLQLPFFFLFAPMVAFVLDKLEKYQAEAIVSVILIVCSLPWLFQTQERPIIVHPGRTVNTSIFAGDRTQLYFATNPEDAASYLTMTDEIKALGIEEIGLNLTDDSEEYPLWALLGAPDSDLRIGWVAASPESQKYLDPDFVPGAIICEQCSGEDIATYRQKYRQETFGDFDLFIK